MQVIYQGLNDNMRTNIINSQTEALFNIIEMATILFEYYAKSQEVVRRRNKLQVSHSRFKKTIIMTKSVQNPSKKSSRQPPRPGATMGPLLKRV